MKKIWFFVEGDSEENLIKSIIHCFYHGINLEKDESKFINDQYDKDVCYCHNVGGVNRIAYEINDYNYKISRSGSNEVIVVCDVEDLKCNSSRLNAIQTRLVDETKKLNIYYVFFNPIIENLYWNCPSVLKRTIEIIYARKFGDATLVKDINLPQTDCISKHKLKLLFQHYDIKYSERQFSNIFFPRVPYD